MPCFRVPIQIYPSAQPESLCSYALYKLNESAQKKIIFILGKDSVINAVVLDDLPASVNCEVFEKAEILSFDKVIFEEIMKKDFELTKIIISSLNQY